MADNNRLFDWVDEGDQDAFERGALVNRRGIKPKSRTIPLASNLGSAATVINKLMTGQDEAGGDLINKLTGSVAFPRVGPGVPAPSNTERMTTWPERMMRGVHGTLMDAATGDLGTVRPDAAGMVSDEDISKRQQRDFQGVQDLSNLVVGGSMPMVAAKGGMKNALGTGAVPKETVRTPTLAEATQYAKRQLEETSRMKWDEYPKDKQQAALRNAYDYLATREKPEPVAVFYSGVENALEHSTTALATPDQWLGTLKNARGVKPEEMQWLGVEDFLAEKKAAGEKVSRAELQEFVKNNKIDVKEVNKKGVGDDNIKNRAEIQAEDDLYDDFAAKHPALSERALASRFERYQESDAYQSALDARIEHHMERYGATENGTRYSDYQLPGGRDYGELLLTLPHKKQSPTTGQVEQTAKLLARSNGEDWASISQNKRQQYEKEAVQEREKVGGDYLSSHWDEPNVLAHVRYNTRDIPTDVVDPRYKAIGDRIEKGGVEAITPEERELYNKLDATGGRKTNKTLHLEEIQSDWHQAGKKRGYGNKSEDAKKLDEAIKTKKEIEQSHFITGMPGSSIYEGQVKKLPFDIQQKYNAAIENINNLARINPENHVPDAPFKKSWPELAFKRMLRHAAENGYDAISWTPGEAQAARYDLSKQLDKLVYDPEKGRLRGFKNDAAVIDHKGVDEPKLADFVGKEAAEKIKNQKPENGGDKVLSGVDLKVGGEGMKRFYDDQLVAIASKYAKAHGGKVEQKPVGNTLEITEATPPVSSAAQKLAPSGSTPKKRYYVDDPNNPDFSIRDFDTRAQAEDFVKQNSPSVHYMELPTGLRDTALSKGFPLFSHGVMLTPVEGNPFEAKDKKERAK